MMIIQADKRDLHLSMQKNNQAHKADNVSKVKDRHHASQQT